LLLGEGNGGTADFLPRLAQLRERADAPLAPGETIGPYRLIRELGAGGMASVWLAQRADGALVRQVALKLPRVFSSDGALAARMAREQDILASLEHPNIARLYDAGVDARGRPFLALEYVDGVPLDAYSRDRALTVRQRLDLFLQIAKALAFAHARLIVHRDLKPANILVTATGEVRLLDFGIARLLSAGIAERGLHTRFGLRALTPSYAAPEQFSGEPITVSTDVYSLGVLLYELLTGTSPYAGGGSSTLELEEAVVASEPPLASAVCKPADRRALRGDLDNVLMRAMKKSPADRYPSVEAFAADVERYLDGLPVAARAPSRRYRAMKFVRRNAVTLGAAAAFGLALMIGLGVALWQADEAARQRTIALERLVEAEDAADFMSAVLIEGIRSNEAVTLDDMLSRAEEIAERSGSDEARVRSFATDFVAKWQMAHGKDARAERFLTRKIAALSRKPAAQTSLLVCTRAEAWARLGRGGEAVEALTREIARTEHDPRVAAHCLFARGRVAAADRDVDGALTFALAGQRRAEEAGERSQIERASALAQIGYAYSLNQLPDRAEHYFARSLRTFELAGRADSDESIGVRMGWAGAAVNRGTPLTALRTLDEALAISRRRSPTGEPSAALAVERANVLRLAGRLAEARTAVDYATELAGRSGDEAAAIYALHSRVDLARRAGDFGSAQELLDAAAARMNGNTHGRRSMALRQRLFQAQVWAARGRLLDAHSGFTDVLDSYRQLRCCSGAVVLARVGRAEVALAQNHPARALADAREALAVARQAQGETPHSSHTGLAWLAIARIRAAEGNLPLAAQAYLRASEHLTGAVGQQHPDTRRARQALAALPKRASGLL
jgi:serine/threonine-protein kinase